MRQLIASGDVELAVGTHALIQEEVEFRDLAVVVVDEQHRFGVEQRSALRGKGDGPDVLLMTATPIPRTLGHDRLRRPRHLRARRDAARPHADRDRVGAPRTGAREAYERLRDEVAAGHQAYVVCPLIEDVRKSRPGRRGTRRAAAEAELKGLRRRLPARPVSSRPRSARRWPRSARASSTCSSPRR